MSYNQIINLQWGSIATSDGSHNKDAIVSSYPTEEWNWKLFGLHHDPGYTSDVINNIYTYVLKKYPNINNILNFRIFISTGVHQAVKVPKRLQCGLDRYAIFLQSKDCVDAYNEHVKAGYPGIIFLHSTC